MKAAFQSNRNLILFGFALFTLFLTFQYLISIDFGFKLRVPHFIVGGCFISFFVLVILKKQNFVLYYASTLLFLFILIFISVLNKSIFSIYFYYFLFIFFTSYSIFYFLLYYRITYDLIARLIVYMTLPHIFMSYFTISSQWYGGLQIFSYSDFPTFFAMQLSIIFPLIHFVKERFLRIFFQFFFLFTIFILGSRGALLAILLSYGIIYRSKLSFKKIIILFMIIVFLIMIIYDVNPNLINYYFMKLNPFGENYNNVSDFNRWLYIIATQQASLEDWHWLLGSGIKTNAQIIQHFFQVNTFNNVAILSDATVHNLFLELYSDYGIVVLGSLVVLMLDIYIKINKAFLRNFEFLYIKLSFIIFIVNYNLEPNYVHFFFWFFIFFYLFSVKSVHNQW